MIILYRLFGLSPTLENLSHYLTYSMILNSKAMFGSKKVEGKCEGKKIERKSRRKEKMKENKN